MSIPLGASLFPSQTGEPNPQPGGSAMEPQEPPVADWVNPFDMEDDPYPTYQRL